MKCKKIITIFTLIFMIFIIFNFNKVSKSDPVNFFSPSVNGTNFVSFSISSWSNSSVISDDDTGWNDGTSWYTNIAVDSRGNVHVVWQDETDGEWGTDSEIMYTNYTTMGWSNATPISDLYGWNDDASLRPSIAVDGSGNVHVVWYDDTDGEWGSDREIMYAKYTPSGWSNATAISDLYRWNDGDSHEPSIAVDGRGIVHVVWQDYTDGEWGTDTEIMYANYTITGWSNATVISDIYGWNNGSSGSPRIAVDGNDNLHVVWSDSTDGEWGSDSEIMYTNCTAGIWSNATAISGLYGWNNGNSLSPSVAADNSGNVHVTWQDYTDGEWGSDIEIMYTNYNISGWSNATVISDLYGWNNGESYTPSVAVDGGGNVHVTWHDDTNGEWGSDMEVMYTNYTAAGWLNATVISDDNTGWNDGWSGATSIAVENGGNIHVAWDDDTVGVWGTDQEIMYTIMSEKPTSNHPADILTDIISSERINWVLYDETGGGKYRVWVTNTNNNNSLLWINWTTWTKNTNLKIPINRSVEGIFNYTIEYYDFHNQYGISDTVFVGIKYDIRAPFIPPIGASRDISFLYLIVFANVVAAFTILAVNIYKKRKKIKMLEEKISKTTVSKT